MYWLYLYEALEAAGIEVLVVNGRHVKNLPGRKTDMADCQWLATLHAHGLLLTGREAEGREALAQVLALEPANATARQVLADLDKD